MRTASLIALISTALEMLMQVLLLTIDAFRFQFDDYRVLRELNISSRCLSILFTGSLLYFFFVFYRKRMSREPSPAKKPIDAV
jgi:hypothetical protein